MSASDRSLIAKLARAAHGGLVTVETAATALSVSSRAASLKLTSLARRGWLRRVRRGLYLVLPLEVEPGRPAVAEDPWVVAREVFSPCYIGGWSAAEHWGLTEQIFRSTLVVTAAPIRSRSVTLLGHEYRLFRVPPAWLKEPTLVWRGAERVAASDRERTIVDCLDYPELCGGMRHLIDILRTYGNAPERNLTKLLREARRRCSGAGWKRLGYLAELLWPDAAEVTTEAKRRLTTGVVDLDPAVRRRGRLVRRWRLRVNVSVSEAAGA